MTDKCLYVTKKGQCRRSAGGGELFCTQHRKMITRRAPLPNGEGGAVARMAREHWASTKEAALRREETEKLTLLLLEMLDVDPGGLI